MAPPLQRSRGDLIATGVISLITVVAVTIALFSAPIRSSELTPAAEEFVAESHLTEIPSAFTEIARADDHSPSLTPVTSEGITIAAGEHRITGYAPDGSELWAYERVADLCALAAAWGKAVATYRTNLGCGDVVAIDSTSGEYAGTRSAPAPDEVVSISSNDRVGTVGAPRVELWRNDLVRTVEYGTVEAPQEADMQPNPNCTITSALTRTSLLAVTEICGEETWLRLQDTTPEDSREPEIMANTQVSPVSILVSIGQTAAAVYDPTTSEVIGIDSDGVEVSRSNVQPMEQVPAPYKPVVADLPHHMSYFDGSRLMLLDPDTLAVTTIYEGALGTGVAIANRLLYPIEDGIAVANWNTQEIEKTIPVDRGGHIGNVALAVAGESLVEKRGSQLVFLSARNA
ncbi:Rv3212 family protein [Corynebacterium cystitidis]|uniref:PQQ-like domain-containing protein n=1 Tax=Corynebacterium cystitidis DSM 20524 TaxID=1121357 RepID=A0A1H9QG89_9CORY|nr:hypothetical protein [Corynebacterium cystitidis]WJY81799.1 hypothetical protein CCYS_04225 [Corynebacterium cystitidis DSM 20524]SER59462.1 hypothetical protein SAMN05661109_00522 [Corynebacterium cystitidis DSM 20524]SNV83506.1 putative secreted protein [Corynebacterium cystitidis]